MAFKTVRGPLIRRHKRHKVSIPITLVMEQDRALGFTKDISESGIRAFVSQPLKSGAQLVLRLDKVGDAPSLSVMAFVRHSKGAEHGLEFTALSADQKRFIQDLYYTSARA